MMECFRNELRALKYIACKTSKFRAFDRKQGRTSEAGSSREGRQQSFGAYT